MEFAKEPNSPRNLIEISEKHQPQVRFRRLFTCTFPDKIIWYHGNWLLAICIEPHQQIDPSDAMAAKPLTIRDPMFLGLDISTQQLKAVVTNEDGKPAHHAAVQFDRDLPHYGTINGAIRGPDQGEVTSPVEMWLEAVDLLLERLRDNGVDFGAIRAVSGAAQVL